MKLMAAVIVTALAASTWANSNSKTTPNGPMWGSWNQGIRMMFINHQRTGPSFVWMTIRGTQLIFKGKVSRLSGADSVLRGSLYEVDGIADKDLSVVRDGRKCLLRKPVIGLIGLLEKERRKLTYGGVGSIHGELTCPGAPSRLMSASLSGSWNRL